MTSSTDSSVSDDELARRILDFVYHPSYQPLKAKGIHTALDLDLELYPGTRRAIKELVQQGELAYGGNHLVLTPEQVSGDPKQTRGTFRQAAGGFGFVRPVSTGKLGPVDDIFIPAAATGSAMEGDTVQVRLRRNRRGGGFEGEVVDVLQRARRQFAGTFAVRDGQAVVAPGTASPRD